MKTRKAETQARASLEERWQPKVAYFCPNKEELDMKYTKNEHVKG